MLSFVSVLHCFLIKWFLIKSCDHKIINSTINYFMVATLILGPIDLFKEFLYIESNGPDKQSYYQCATINEKPSY